MMSSLSAVTIGIGAVLYNYTQRVGRLLRSVRVKPDMQADGPQAGGAEKQQYWHCRCCGFKMDRHQSGEARPPCDRCQFPMDAKRPRSKTVDDERSEEWEDEDQSRRCN
jgi:uncharacterized paraquat-inducible protein A